MCVYVCADVYKDKDVDVGVGVYVDVGGDVYVSM